MIFVNLKFTFFLFFFVSLSLFLLEIHLSQGDDDLCFWIDFITRNQNLIAAFMYDPVTVEREFQSRAFNVFIGGIFLRLISDLSF